MQAGHQSAGISYWDHGALVAARFRDLMSPTPSMNWHLPAWFTENQEWIRSELAADFQTILTYHQWHDCGKPYCLTIDENGKKHYPNHAEVSSRIWMSLGGDAHIGGLILKDMMCHTLRPPQAADFAQNEPDALILLTTALCELHANATMFGGFQSDSFKIKYKRLDRCGSTILSVLKEQS